MSRPGTPDLAAMSPASRPPFSLLPAPSSARRLQKNPAVDRRTHYFRNRLCSKEQAPKGECVRALLARRLRVRRISHAAAPAPPLAQCTDRATSAAPRVRGLAGPPRRRALRPQRRARGHTATRGPALRPIPRGPRNNCARAPRCATLADKRCPSRRPRGSLRLPVPPHSSEIPNGTRHHSVQSAALRTVRTSESVSFAKKSRIHRPRRPAGPGCAQRAGRARGAFDAVHRDRREGAGRIQSAHDRQGARGTQALMPVSRRRALLRTLHLSR